LWPTLSSFLKSTVAPLAGPPETCGTYARCDWFITACSAGAGNVFPGDAIDVDRNVLRGTASPEL